MVDLFGVSLFSSWFNLALFTIELLIAEQYFHHFPKDARWLHYMVIVMVVADILGTIGSCASTWIFLITYRMAPIMHHLWTMPVIVVTTAVSAMLEQSFLIYRIYTLSKAKIISGILMLLVIIHVTFTIVSAVYLVLIPTFVLNFGTTATTISFCIEAAVDILIPIALLWQLRKVNSGFASTRSLIRQISIQALTSGSVVALVGIIFLALFWTNSVVFIVITNFHGRIYTITVLVNLLARRKRSPGKSTTIDSNGANISRLFDIDLTSAAERSIAPHSTEHTASTVAQSSGRGSKQRLELHPQPSGETLQGVV